MAPRLNKRQQRELEELQALKSDVNNGSEEEEIIEVKRGTERRVCSGAFSHLSLGSGNDPV